MYLVESNKKRILHTGDFRGHGRKKNAFDEVINNIGKVDFLITEGTTLTRGNDKFITEEELENGVLDIIKKYDQVFIMQSSTNVDRTVSFIKASLQSNKKFVLDLFSYYINDIVDFNVKVDFKKIFVWRPYRYRYKPTWFKDKYLDLKTSAGIFPYFVMEVKESMLMDIKMLYE